VEKKRRRAPRVSGLSSTCPSLTFSTCLLILSYPCMQRVTSALSGDTSLLLSPPTIVSISRALRAGTPCHVAWILVACGVLG
jgi:hypothetical protein